MAVMTTRPAMMPPTIAPIGADLDDVDDVEADVEADV